MSWVKLEDGRSGKWTAKAVYPSLISNSELNRFFNREIKRDCESLFHEAVYSQSDPARFTKEFSVKAILSVVNERIACGLITVERSGQPTELHPVMCWLHESQPVHAVWGNLVIAGSSADDFARTLLLPALNEVRRANSLSPLPEFPRGLLDGFVVTKSNVSWILPPGIAGRNSTQLKISHNLVRTWADPRGPLGYLWPVSVSKISFGLLVKWPIREDVPRGGALQISLFRGREDPVALGVQTFPVKDPPMDVRCEFLGIVVDPEERLFVDVRIVNNGQTFYRNREPARMPALGWQTMREMRLDRER